MGGGTAFGFLPRTKGQQKASQTQRSIVRTDISRQLDHRRPSAIALPWVVFALAQHGENGLKGFVACRVRSEACGLVGLILRDPFIFKTA